MSKEETLADLQENREAYAIRVEAVEADLARERTERLAVYTTQIRNLVLRAYAEGASIAAIQRAYGTRDFRTIKRILDSGSAEVEQYKVEAVERKNPTWFTVYEDSGDPFVTICHPEGDATFEVVVMEGAEYMLYAYDTDPNPELGLKWDGRILLPESSGEDAELYGALLNALMP